jgi:hypothetical protein
MNDHLGDAIMIAQVDKQHAAMIATVVEPARKADSPADMAWTDVAAGMGTVRMHELLFR